MQTSIIVGTSPSIEPSKANAYTHRTRAGSHLVKNLILEEELEKAKRIHKKFGLILLPMVVLFNI
jgi:ribonucleotide reductase alpha subunit